MDLSDWIALVVGSVAIISSVVVPTITSWFNRSGAAKLQASELFFHEKVTTYYDFLGAATDFLGDPDDKTRLRLMFTVYRAMLFSTNDTLLKLAILSELLNRAETPEQIRLFPYAEALNDAVYAMREELETFQKPLGKSK